MTTIAENLSNVLYDIDSAIIESGRQKGCVRLCAVSKFHPMEEVVQAVNAGQVLFGENRVQEAAEKFAALNQLYPGKAQLHIIGALQSNKAKKACSIADCIQSCDRVEILSELNKHAIAMNKKLSVYLELLTGEDTKTGFASEDNILKVADMFANGIFPALEFNGLMTMAPFVDDEVVIGKSFSRLRLLKENINAQFPDLPVKELSMGMSGDFKIAIKEGSTMVRVGTAIFGERNYGHEK